MANLVPYDRNRNLFSAMDNFFDDMWMMPRNPFSNSFKVDVREEEKQFIVEAEMPGVDKGDISLQMDDGRLTIQLNHKEESNNEDKEKGYIHRERRVSSMARTVYLAGAGDENITAKLNDGLLTITVPKQEEIKKDKNINID